MKFLDSKAEEIPKRQLYPFVGLFYAYSSSQIDEPSYFTANPFKFGVFAVYHLGSFALTFTPMVYLFLELFD